MLFFFFLELCVRVHIYTHTDQIHLTEPRADPQQVRLDAGKRDERGQMIADDHPVVVLGPRRRGGQEHGAAQRVRYQVQSVVSAVRARQHEIDHGRQVVIRPLVQAAKTAKFAKLPAKHSKFPVTSTGRVSVHDGSVDGQPGRRVRGTAEAVEQRLCC